MSENRKYYWIKLKEDFLNGDAVEFLMRQQDGAKYVVLYLMLCMMVKNNGGELTYQLGDVIMQYDVQKIVLGCRYFDSSTVVVALELYKKIGLIYEQEDGVLKISGFDSMVGVSTTAGDKQKRYRESKKLENNVALLEDGGNIRYPDRYPDIDIEIDKEIDKEDILSGKPDSNLPKIKEIVEYLNQKTGKNFKYNTQKTQSCIKARLKEGFSVDDFKTVINIKTEQWGKDPKMSVYLRPETLFGTKFEGYLNEAPKKKEVRSVMTEQERAVAEAKWAKEHGFGYDPKILGEE